MTELTYAKPKWYDSLIWEIKDLPRRYKAWRTERMLRKIVRWTDTNYLTHARHELPGCKPDADEMDVLMAHQIFQLLAVFAHHRHSGFSAGFAIQMFEKLAMFKPLGPLTGSDDEWADVGHYTDNDLETRFQNKRCSHVFKEVRPDGTEYCYDSEGRIFREPDGCCYTSRDSRVEITFPYTPKHEYVDVEKDD